MPARAQETPEKAPTPVNIDVSETSLLLRNLLKDCAKESNTEAQYKLYVRSRGVYDQLAPFLDDAQQRTYRNAITKVFKSLGLPRTVVTDLGVTLHLRRVGTTTYYWSDAVPSGAFATFLNDAKVPGESLEQWFHDRPVKLNERANRFFATDDDAPVKGGSYFAAQALKNWLSRRDRVSYSMPTATMVPPRSTISYWTDRTWSDNKQLQRMQNLRMFGAEFKVLVLNGKPIGEFPEASVSNVTFHYAINVASGKKLYVKQVTAAGDR
jgi:hypothetical protein